MRSPSREGALPRFWFFDLDGTLADTDGDIRRAWKAALSDLGLECPDFDDRFVTGPPIEEVVPALFPDVVCTPELIARVRAGFAAHYDHDGFPGTREYPGVLDRVRALKARGARVFIVTNKRHAGATAMAAKFGWDAVFEGVYAGDMWRDDPAVGRLRKPQLLARVMERVGATAAESVMVGDTASDFEAAEANGVASVGVTWGYGRAGELARATRLAHSADELWS